MPLIFMEQPFPGSLLGIWQITETSGELEQLCTLSGEDRAQVDSFRNDLRKCQWLACRKILEELGFPFPRIWYNPAGKPFLEGSTASVSFSHSGIYAAALFAGGFRVGIDIEVPRDRIVRVADRFLHTDESERTIEPNRLEKLYIYWCAKEAVFKLSGEHGVNFMEDLRLEPFDYLCTGEGNGRASLKQGGTIRHFPVRYRVTKEYVLVSTAELNKPLTG